MELTACKVNGPRWVGGRRPGTVEEVDTVGEYGDAVDGPGTVEEVDTVGEYGDAVDGEGGHAGTGQNWGEAAAGENCDDGEVPGRSSELIELWRRKGVAGASEAVIDHLADMQRQLQKWVSKSVRLNPKHCALHPKPLNLAQARGDLRRDPKPQTLKPCAGSRTVI
jgi:hypothetical protein